MNLSNLKLGIGIPLNFPSVPDTFFHSFIQMEKPDFCYIRASSGPVEEMRNQIVIDALKSRCTHLIMMDTDQVYHPKTITQLLSHRLPVVGCLVYRRYPPFDPLMLKGSISKYQTVSEWEPGSLVEVDATGTGCLMFDTEVFRKLPAPWFRFRKSLKGPVGEDIGFCSDLREKGYRIFVDTSVPAGHISPMIVNEGTWRLWNRLQEARRQYRIEHNSIHMED